MKICQVQNGLVDYTSWYPKEKDNKVSDYNDELSVAILEKNSASAKLLDLNIIQSAPPVNNLSKTHDPATQIITENEYGINWQPFKQTYFSFVTRQGKNRINYKSQYKPF